MKIISWNINGLRTRIQKGFKEAIEELNPDILCLQEVRAEEEQLPKDFLIWLDNTFDLNIFNPHSKKGYAGVSVFSKILIDDEEEFEDILPNQEEWGRIIKCGFNGINLFNSYTPNIGRDLQNSIRRESYDSSLSQWLTRYNNQPSILCGDLNVAPQPIDNGAPGIMCGVSKQERRNFQKFLDDGYHDIWREQHWDIKEYTWISSKNNNRGQRIDHFLISESLRDKEISSRIITDNDLRCGSDHRPIELTIEI